MDFLNDQSTSWMSSGGCFRLEPDGVSNPFPHCAGWVGTLPETNWLCAELSGHNIRNPYDPSYCASSRMFCPGSGLGIPCCVQNKSYMHTSQIDCPKGFCEKFY